MAKKIITEVLTSFILNSKVPSELEGCRVLLAQKTFIWETGPWDLEERFKQIFDYLMSLDYSVILCIDIPCHRRIVEGESTLDIIKLLERGTGGDKIRCLITTTPDEFYETSYDNKI